VKNDSTTGMKVLKGRPPIIHGKIDDEDSKRDIAPAYKSCKKY
jgi:hypothetical protein